MDNTLESLWRLKEDVLPRVAYEDDLRNFARALPLASAFVQRRIFTGPIMIEAKPVQKECGLTLGYAIKTKVDCTQAFVPEEFVVVPRRSPKYTRLDELIPHAHVADDSEYVFPLQIDVEHVQLSKPARVLEFPLPVGYQCELGSVIITHPNDLRPTVVNLCFSDNYIDLPSILDRTSDTETRATFSEIGWPMSLNETECHYHPCSIRLTCDSVDDLHVLATTTNYNSTCERMNEFHVAFTARNMGPVYHLQTNRNVYVIKLRNVVSVMGTMNMMMCHDIAMRGTDYFSAAGTLSGPTRFTQSGFAEWLQKNAIYIAGYNM